MGTIIAIANQKGGSGKTTLTTNLSVSLAAAGYKVLAVDSDPQGTLSKNFGLTGENIKVGLAKLYHECIHMYSDDDADIEDIDTVGAVEHTGTVDVLPVINDTFNNIDKAMVGAMRNEYILSTILEPVIDIYDYILIDCPPYVGALMTNSLTAADTVIIPTRPSDNDVSAVLGVQRIIVRVKKLLNQKLSIAGVVGMFVPNTKEARKQIARLETILQDVNVPLFNQKIPHTTKGIEADGQHKSVSEYAQENPKDKTARELADTYKLLAGEVIENGI